jgi:deoxyribodipyrimidine photolyase
MNKEKISIFWFRRDLRLDDNHGLYEALKGQFPVLSIFIFDENITNELDESDSRITFIYDQLISLSVNLKKFDPEMTYINKWIPELNSLSYPSPIVDHKAARERAIATYKRGILLSIT